MEIHADMVLMDDREGVIVARSKGIPVLPARWASGNP